LDVEERNLDLRPLDKEGIAEEFLLAGAQEGGLSAQVARSKAKAERRAEEGTEKAA